MTLVLYKGKYSQEKYQNPLPVLPVLSNKFININVYMYRFPVFRGTVLWSELNLTKGIRLH